MKFVICFFSVLLSFMSFSATAQKPSTFPHPALSCHNTLKYNIYFAGIKTGWLTREERWSETGGKISSNSYAGILGIGTRFEQHAEFVWNDEKGFVTTWFTQDVSGFKNRQMKVQISADGHDSHMVVNEEEMQFNNPERAILDADTIAAQLRYQLLKGETSFNLTRQASSMLEHYAYTVEPQQSKSYPQWGELDVVPIKQNGADEVTMWFAPKMDYQLIEARYHSMFLPGRMKLVDWVKECD